MNTDKGRVDGAQMRLIGPHGRDRLVRAIVWAAHHPRRELFLGISTLITIWGNKFFPRFGGWYLGKTGWKSLQYLSLDRARGNDTRARHAFAERETELRQYFKFSVF